MSYDVSLVCNTPSSKHLGVYRNHPVLFVFPQFFYWLPVSRSMINLLVFPCFCCCLTVFRTIMVNWLVFPHFCCCLPVSRSMVNWLVFPHFCCCLPVSRSIVNWLVFPHFCCCLPVSRSMVNWLVFSCFCYCLPVWPSGLNYCLFVNRKPHLPCARHLAHNIGTLTMFPSQNGR